MSNSFRTDEYIIDVWLTERIKDVGVKIPTKRLSLRELLSMDVPFVPLMDGNKHFFNKKDLEKAAEVLGEKFLSAEVFPIIFVSKRSECCDFYILRGEWVDEVFRRLVGISSVNKMPNGQPYTYKSLVLEFIKKYPSLAIITL